MLADPQVFTHNSIAHNLNRVDSSGKPSIYQKADESLIMAISHQTTKKKRKRTLVKFTEVVVAVNPLDSADSHYEDGTINISCDFPEYGFDDAAKKALLDSAIGHLTSAFQDAIFGGQH
jgi:hypothetical protein